MPGLTAEQRRTFAVGNSFFNQNWVTAPASAEGRDGLGPLFNAQSCSSCHFKDGRAQPPAADDDPELGLLFRLSVDEGDGKPGPHPIYGMQFQDRSIRDIDPEGSFRIRITEKPGKFGDGTPFSLAAPTYELVDVNDEVITGVMISPRIAPQMIGVGLLEVIPESDLLAAIDPDDEDADGISGRANMVRDLETGKKVIGRFGWKAAVPSVRLQSALAFANDIGVSSEAVPNEPCTDAQTECLAEPDGGDPELPDKKLEQVTFYSRTLAVPARRDVGEENTSAGQQKFEDIGCASCHTPEQKTGKADIAALSEQTIRPYTDLLLHDMGPDLADNRPDDDATGQEWRTPPLWGVGLVQTVNRHTRFLHDGRARNLTEAILWHGGEAEDSREEFRNLPEDERKSLIEFLESL